MLRKIGEPTPPKGIKLALFRLPIYLYRLNLGFLLGNRFICLKHKGRVSGIMRETVLEVIDQNKTRGTIYSASGFGNKAQWFKNILSNPNVFIALKSRQRKAVVRVLSAEEAEQVLLRYVEVHPNSINVVARLSGYEMDGNRQDVCEFSRIVKIVEFTITPEV